MKVFVTRILLVAAVVVSLLVPVAASKGGSGKTAASGGTKTVHVKGYTKKDGTYVEAHERKAPETKAEKAAEAPVPPAPAPPVAAARDAHGRILRSEAAKHAFEAQTGYPHGRPGYVIDHIKPLACGGADDSSNMQWQTVDAAKAKDKTERVGC